MVTYGETKFSNEHWHANSKSGHKNFAPRHCTVTCNYWTWCQNSRSPCCWIFLFNLCQA